jgi:hypothetical protein
MLSPTDGMGCHSVHHVQEEENNHYQGGDIKKMVIPCGRTLPMQAASIL